MAEVTELRLLTWQGLGKVISDGVTGKIATRR
jgi:hypothetical protein